MSDPVRVSYIFDGPNEAGFILCILTIALAAFSDYLISEKRRKIRVIIFVVFLILTMTSIGMLVTTGSRGCIAATVCGLAICSIMRPSARVLYYGFILFTIFKSIFSSVSSERYSLIFHNDNSVSERMDLLQSSLSLNYDFWMGGIGPESYQKILNLFYLNAELKDRFGTSLNEITTLCGYIGVPLASVIYGAVLGTSLYFLWKSRNNIALAAGVSIVLSIFLMGHLQVRWDRYYFWIIELASMALIGIGVYYSGLKIRIMHLLVINGCFALLISAGVLTLSILVKKDIQVKRVEHDLYYVEKPSAIHGKSPVVTIVMSTSWESWRFFMDIRNLLLDNGIKIRVGNDAEKVINDGILVTHLIDPNIKRFEAKRILNIDPLTPSRSEIRALNEDLIYIKGFSGPMERNKTFIEVNSSRDAAQLIVSQALKNDR